MNHFSRSILVVPVLLAGCSDGDQQQRNVTTASNQQEANSSFPTGDAGKLISPGGNELGTALATDGAEGVTLRVEARGLQPGTHGVQVHSVGTCQGPNFVSAGAARPGSDLPNVTIGSDGLLAETVTVSGAQLSELRDSDGSSLVLHMNPEDPPADQSGNAGDRIACAVI